MTTLLAIDDLDTYVSSRDALHTVAEHVLAKARFLDDREIRLTAFAGGFATPLLGGLLRRRVRVEGGDLVVDEGDGSRRIALTTVAQAANFVGIEPGFPNELYPSATPLRPDQPLGIDEAAANSLAAWYGFTAEVLESFAAEIVGVTPSPLILWPEHFDQAFFTEDDDESRRANYGASPGDEGHQEPYLYVGPWGTPVSDEFWNARSFNGAVVSLSSLVAAADPVETALAFLRTGRGLLVGPTS
jgi:hypothetical protein